MTCHASRTARAVTAAGTAWPRVVGACLDQLEPLPPGANLGIAYFGEQLAPMADAILDALRARTGVRHWVGAGGLAVLNGAQGTATCGLSVLVAALPEAQFHIAPALTSSIADRALVLVHAALDEADPQALLAEIAANAPAGVVGGLTAASRAPVHLAGAAAAGSAVSLGLHRELPAMAGLARACTPLGPAHRVTSALGSTILTLDGRPALAVMTEELGELFRHGGSRAARQLWLADGVASETVPWRVRRISAVDEDSGSLRVDGGRLDGPVRLMRPDPAGSLARIGALARDLRSRLEGREVACGLYLTSRFRSPGLFGPGVSELAVLRAELGGVPLIGLVTDAEIFAGCLHEGAGILVLLGGGA
ncbi:MAG: FIST N-terminal domain-containing protein [Geminicoccaceae bacterium]